MACQPTMDYHAAVHVLQEAELLPTKSSWPKEVLGPSESLSAAAAHISSHQKEV